jgi:FPC/CPF motif-containing protein YcgG
LTPNNPFESELALRHSRYFGTKDGRPVLLSDPDQPPDLFASAVIGAFRGFVLNPQFVCVAAKSAVHHETYRLGIYDRLASPEATAGLSHDLYEFLRETESLDSAFTTFVAAFREPTDLDEIAFEQLLWRQLQMLHERDAPHHDWDPAVSSNPEDPHFSFSFAGHAFFIVGLHPGSARLARQFPWPTMVFNPHAQFERLRETGMWEKLKEATRHRDEELQGDINPVLADFGEETEAKQYSGRLIEPDWHPPFLPHPGIPGEVSDLTTPPEVTDAGCPIDHEGNKSKRAE